MWEHGEGSAVRRYPPRVALLVLAIALLAGARGPARAAAAERPLLWSGPEPLETHGSPWTGLSCATGPLCVAVDGAGDVFTSTDPAGTGGEWSSSTLAGAAEPAIYAHGRVACADAGLCALIGGALGSLFVSSDPSGGAPTWRAEEIDPEGVLDDVACVAPSLCVAVGLHGTIASSSEPAAGAGSWRLTHADGDAELESISCASSELCLATDQKGTVLVSSDPAGGRWSTLHLAWPKPPEGELQGFPVSCVPGPLCLIGNEYAAFASRDPAGGPGGWTEDSGLESGGGVACAAPSRCVALRGNTNGWMNATTEPTAGAAAWVKDGVGPRWMAAVSCVSSTQCVALGEHDVFVSTRTQQLSVTLAGAGRGVVSSPPFSCPFLTCSHEVPSIIEPQEATAIGCGDETTLDLLPEGCQFDFPASNTVTLTAAPMAGSQFAGWGGACAGTSTCTLSMSEDRSVSADFALAVSALCQCAGRRLLTHLRESHDAFLVGRGRTALEGVAAARRPTGTVFSFDLARAATVDIRVEREAGGRRAGGRCESARTPPARAERCSVYRHVVTLARTGHAGANSVAFSGRVGKTALAAGGYRAAFSATSADASSETQYLSFRVLR